METVKTAIFEILLANINVMLAKAAGFRDIRSG